MKLAIGKEAVIAEFKNELKKREYNYPKWIADHSHNLTQEKADSRMRLWRIAIYLLEKGEVKDTFDPDPVFREIARERNYRNYVNGNKVAAGKMNKWDMQRASKLILAGMEIIKRYLGVKSDSKIDIIEQGELF